jgi:hypothetical protein
LRSRSIECRNNSSSTTIAIRGRGPTSVIVPSVVFEGMPVYRTLVLRAASTLGKDPLRRPQLYRNLFVEQTSDDEGEHLTLPRGQRSESVAADPRSVRPRSGPVGIERWLD